MSELAAFHAAAERLWLRLNPAWPGLSLEIVPQADSTNTRLLERLRQSAGSGACVLVALEQTAGRGRLARQWVAQAGASLTLSIALPWPLDGRTATNLSGLSLAVGVAAAEALHESVQLKWPNDLCVRDGSNVLGKLGGILIETVSSGSQVKALVIGLGLNIGSQAATAAATRLDASAPAQPLPPMALGQLRPSVSAAQCFEEVVPPILAAVAAFADQGLGPFLARYAQRDALKECEVQILGPTPTPAATWGRVIGIDASGCLLVHTAAGLQALSSGEVSVRPIAQAA